MKKLDRGFFNRNTLKVAQELLGKFIVRRYGKKIITGKVVETEAYMGPLDLASHASRGKTPRTEIMFGKPGIAYIYLIYGMYYCFNVVTEKKSYPAAVLIRAIETSGNEKLANGPGKLCYFFKIDKLLNGEDTTTSKKLWLEDRREKIKKSEIIARKRIGVDYAQHSQHYLWRFYIKDNLCVSKR